MQNIDYTKDFKINISVVIPTHNRIEDLRRAVESVAAQTVLPAEILVVDDGSFPKVDSSIFSEVPTIINCVLLRNDQSKGGNYSRNKGVSHATGEWIAFLDDDDLFKQNKLETVLSYINKHPNIDFIYHPAEIVMVNENVRYISQLKPFSYNEDPLHELLICNRIGGTSMVIIRRQFFLDNEGFDNDMPALQDYEFWLRLAKNGGSFHMLATPLTIYQYVTSKKSVTKSLEVNSYARTMLEYKYREDFATLSINEQNLLSERKQLEVIHKLLLNGQPRDAIKQQFKLLWQTKRTKHLLVLLLMIIDTRLLYILKSKFGV